MAVAAEHYDCVVIGCGMSGLAAAIRLALYDRKVLIVERHNAPGGLNSFYSFEGRKFDVGLHAVTNFVPPGTRRAPLTKLFRQLRIPPEAFALCPQKGSRVSFPGESLRFTNDFSVLESEVARAFPGEIDGFRKLTQAVDEFNAFDMGAAAQSTREILGRYIKDPVLTDMLLCPLLYYGSARENDIDWDQFVILFRAIFQEGFARPYDGVRVIIRALLNKYRDIGGKRKMKCGVRRIHTAKNRVSTLELDDGTTLTADCVLSSIGAVETLRLCEDQPADASSDNIGRLSFVETITIFDRSPQDFGWDDTIVFFNDSERFHYERPSDPVDPRSGVICVPNNYDYGDEGELDEGVFRVTAMANYDYWTSLPEDQYKAEKERWYGTLQEKVRGILPPVSAEEFKAATRYVDMFTPRTITKFTGHLQGAVYGAPHKYKDGRTHLDNLYLCGTDQGFLGIVGSMLSGISMANAYGLK